MEGNQAVADEIVKHANALHRQGELELSVVLLDEFEKAHRKVWDLFLQVRTRGREARTPTGRRTSFRSTRAGRHVK